MRRYKTPEQLKAWRRDWEPVWIGMLVEGNGIRRIEAPRWKAKEAAETFKAKYESAPMRKMIDYELAGR